MMLLTITPAAKAAIREYRKLMGSDAISARDDGGVTSEQIAKANINDTIDHQLLIEVSRYLVRNSAALDATARQWRLETLLKGTAVYEPRPAPKPEHTLEYKKLMQRLRAEEEQRQYERKIDPLPPADLFNQRFPKAAFSFGSGINIGHNAADDVDDVTYADVNRQMVLIINVLISIVCTSVAVWMAARRWSVPQRLGLSFSGSTVVAMAEVAIYLGYIRRIKDAKTMEKKVPEKKEITDTWVIDGKSTSQQAIAGDTTRFRKGRHR